MATICRDGLQNRIDRKLGAKKEDDQIPQQSEHKNANTECMLPIQHSIRMQKVVELK